MAFLLRSSKCLRNFAEISKIYPWKATPSYNRQGVDGEYSRIFISKCWFRMHNGGKRTRSINESLNKIDENIKQYKRLRRLEVDALMTNIAETENVEPVQALAALKCFGSILTEELPEIRTKLAQNVWNLIQSRGISIDIEHYNALLTVYIENEHDFKFDDIFKELQLKNLCPNRQTYQLLIEKYATAGDVENINKTLTTMKSTAHTEWNIDIYNSLILANGYAGNFEAVNSYLDKLNSSGLESTTLTYRNLMLPYARIGAIDKIITALEQYLDKEIQLTDGDILGLIYELAINGHSDCVDQLLPFIQYNGGYNSEAHECVLKLLNKNRDDVAFSMLKTMIPRDGSFSKQPDNRGRFYLKQILKLKRPMEQVFDVCEKLQKNGISENPINSLLYAAANVDSSGLGLQIIYELHRKCIPLTTNHFIPILLSTSNPNEALRILKIMQNDFNLKPDTYLLIEYVIDAFGTVTFDELIDYLQQADISQRTAVVAVASKCLRVGKIREAADLIERYKSGIFIHMFKDDLSSSLFARNDAQNFVKFLRISYENSRLMKQRNTSPSQSEELGEFIAQTITSLQRMPRPEVIEAIIAHLIDAKLRIPIEYVKEIQSIVSPHLAPGLDQLIDIDYAAPSNNTEVDPRLALLSSYYELNNLMEYRKCMKQLKEEQIRLLPACYVHLIILEVAHNDVPAALETFNKARAKYPNLTLNKSISISTIVAYLYKQKGLQEAIEFLVLNKPDGHKGKYNDANLDIYGKLLYRVAETGNGYDVNTMFDKLIELNYFKLRKNVSDLNVLAALVKVHLKRNDIVAACDSFVYLATEHKCLPLRSELLKYLIESNDKDNLQRVTKALAGVSGLNGSQLSLAIAYMTCGKLMEASQIFSSKISFIGPQPIEFICKHFVKNKRVDLIETLLELTQNVNYYDKTIVWNKLFDVYCSDDTIERVVKLMEQIRKARVPVDRSFVYRLNGFFNQKGKEMPFTLQVIEPKSSVRHSELQNQKQRGLSEMELSKFIDDKELVCHRLTDMRQLKLYLKNLSETGEVEKFEVMRKNIPNDIRFESKFDSFMIGAYLKSGQIDEFINRIIELVKTADSDDQLDALAKELLSTTYLDVLKVAPNAIIKLEELAIEFAQKGRYDPINAIWCYYVIQNNYAASWKVWNEYLLKIDKIDFGAIINTSKLAVDDKLARNLVDFLKTHPKITRRSLGVAYNLLIMNLIKSKKYDESFEIVEESLKNSCYEYLQPMSLERLSRAFQRLGKVFPYEMPKQIKTKNTNIKSN